MEDPKNEVLPLVLAQITVVSEKRTKQNADGLAEGEGDLQKIARKPIREVCHAGWATFGERPNCEIPRVRLTR